MVINLEIGGGMKNSILNKGIILQRTLSAQIIRNTRMLCITDKANKLPYCKRNIMNTMILLWDWVFTEFVERVILGLEHADRHLNANKKCKKFLLDNQLSHPEFTEFFFAFHEPLTAAFLRVLEYETSNGHSIDKKLKIVATELTELLNLARIELDGMRVDCSLLGSAPICPKHKQYGERECEEIDNILTVMITPDYYLEPDLFNQIMSASKFLKNGKKFLIVVDYKNFDTRKNPPYEWAKNGGPSRYKHCMDVVTQVYFYNWQDQVDFGDWDIALKPFKIPNKVGLKQLSNSWIKEKRLIYF